MTKPSIISSLKDLSDEEKRALLTDKKILIADDHNLNRKTMEGWFYCYNCETDTASNGEELIEIYKSSLDENGKSDFDLIVTDFTMPIKNGDQVIEEIRKLEKENSVSEQNQIPIIIVSGNSDQKLLQNILAPRTRYFVKGSDQNQLLEMVLELITD